MPSLDSISFDTSGFHLDGDESGVRVWRTEAGDGLGLYYFPRAPDIQANVDSVDEVRNYYRQSCAEAGAAIIEVDTLIIDDCRAIRTIIKSPGQPTGMNYLGSITLPFRDLSLVVKIQCEENATTGIRDAVVADRLMGDGRITIGEDGIQGWMQDPYDPSIVGGLARNLSEDEEYDKDFPDHPLSRLRSILRRIEGTLRVGNDVKGEPAFKYDSSQKLRRWWRPFG